MSEVLRATEVHKRFTEGSGREAQTPASTR